MLQSNVHPQDSRKLRKKRTIVPSILENAKVQVSLLFLLTVATLSAGVRFLVPTLMEARNFITAREITQHGHWLLPTMNGYLRLAKPPMPTWFSAWSGLLAGDVENVMALRVPAVLAAFLMVLFLYLLARELTKDKLLPFLAGAVLASSYGFLEIGYQATWDIYCHAFMMGAIWLFVKALKRKDAATGLFLGAGVFLGLSFLSKGPVSFYALLLPFLLAYGLGFGFKSIAAKGQGFLLATGVCLLLSLPWPLYVYFSQASAFSQTMEVESQSWANRHVKVFWYYWKFPLHAGLWVLFLSASLVVPYARRRVARLGNYWFMVGWVLLAVLLLSIIPEKKMRYLMPVMAPAALLTSFYIRYLIDAFRQKQFSKGEFWLVMGNATLLALVALAVPVFFYLFLYRSQEVSLFFLVALSVVFPLLGAGLVYLAAKKKILLHFLLVFAFHSLVMLVCVPYLGAAFYPETAYAPLRESRQVREIRQLPYYAVDGMGPEYVWEVGKPVDTLRVEKNLLQLPGQLPAVVFSREPLSPSSLQGRNIQLRLLQKYYFNPEDPTQVYYLQVLAQGQKEGE